MTLRNTAIWLLALLVVAGPLSCASSNQNDEVDPFEMADEEEGDLLSDDSEQSEPTRRPARQQASQEDDEMFVIPEAASRPARPVDARSDGWDMSEKRVFRDADHVYDGASRWEGDDDASFSAVVDTDDSHVYFWLEVTDDRIVESPPSNPLDAAVIRLRDPRLDDLLSALPEALRDRLDVEIEAAYRITPDGRFAARNPDRSVPEGAVHTATTETDDGYIVEAAFALEALPYLAEIPMDEIAFRLDVFDADSRADRPDKRLSAIIDDGEPKYAVTGTDGILPAVAPEDRPPRRDALGVWHRSEKNWTFEPFEYLSDRWQVLEQRKRLDEQLREVDAYPEICDRPDSEYEVLEAYEYQNGSHRVALARCGPPAEDSCPSEARSQVVWAHLKQDDERWNLEAAHEVFETPLEQCLADAPEDKPRHHGFSMLPFDRIGTEVWGIGYHRTFEASEHLNDQTAVRLVDPRSPDFVLLDRQLEHVDASGRERTLHESRIYLTELDDNEGLDVCHVEEIREQTCEDFMSGCETVSRGHEVIPHIQLWNDEEHRFEDYLLTRHEHCRGSTRFEDIAPGYQILLIGERLGLLPTRR